MIIWLLLNTLNCSTFALISYKAKQNALVLLSTFFSFNYIWSVITI